MPDVKTAYEIAASPYVFAILFIVVLFTFYKWINKNYDEHKKDSKEREDKLFNQLEKTNDTQTKIVTSLEKIESNLGTLEKRMDSGFRDVWDHLDQMDNKNN